ncbi:unnamed protein product, partial [marine sediment metagenome]
SDVAVVFVDQIFDEHFTDGTGSFIDLAYTGSGAITPTDVVDAISTIIAHEAGHNLGLWHKYPEEVNPKQLIMLDGNYLLLLPDQLRGGEQQFSTESLSVNGGRAQPLSSEQNEQQQLAFAVGSDDDQVPRTGPSDDAINLVYKPSAKLQIAVSQMDDIDVAEAVLGIVPHGSAWPEIIGLGSGNLSELLDGADILVGDGDRVFLVASTDGDGIDVFSVSPDFTGTVSEINLSSVLTILSEVNIRGTVTDGHIRAASDPSKEVPLPLYQIRVNGGNSPEGVPSAQGSVLAVTAVKIGELGVQSTPTEQVILTGDIAVVDLALDAPGASEYELVGFEIIGDTADTPLVPVRQFSARPDLKLLNGSQVVADVVFPENDDTDFLTEGRFFFAPGTATGFQGQIRIRYMADEEERELILDIQPSSSSTGEAAVTSGSDTLSVVRQQQRLNFLGYRDYDGRVLVVDGIVGPRTRSATRAFQEAVDPTGELIPEEIRGTIDSVTAQLLN